MTQTHKISGPTSIFATLTRWLIVLVASITAIFVIAASAAFALFVVFGLLLLGASAYLIFWVRNKIKGQPSSPADMFRQRTDTAFGQIFGTAPHSQSSRSGTGTFHERHPQQHTGKTIDAHETPHGWSVDK